MPEQLTSSRLKYTCLSHKKKKKDGITHTRQHFPCRTSSIRDEYICNWQALNEFPEYVDEVQLTEELNSEREMERAVIQYLMQEGVSES